MELKGTWRLRFSSQSLLLYKSMFTKVTEMVNPQLLLPELKAGRSKETVVKIQEMGRAYADDIGLVDEQVISLY